MPHRHVFVFGLRVNQMSLRDISYFGNINPDCFEWRNWRNQYDLNKHMF